MPTGEITSLQSETSIGVIRQTDIGEELFFHAAALVNETFDRLTKGQQVEFDRQAYGNSSRKSRAVNVRTREAAA